MKDQDKPTILVYSAADKRLESVTDKAARVWNDVLSGYVELRRSSSILQPTNIQVRWGKPGEIRNDHFPDRTARCERFMESHWWIALEPDVNWAFSKWRRVFGLGEDALACLVHELGHVFNLPHSDNPDWVMCPEVGGSGRLSTEEKESYRSFFAANLTT